MKIRDCFIVTLLAMTTLFTFCGGGHKKEAPAREVSTAKAATQTIERKVMFTGSIEAEDAIEVFAKASGIVSKKLLKEGDAVKIGQAVLMVDRDEVGYKFRQMPVESPINGLVGKIPVDVGGRVYSRDTNPSEPAMVIVRPGTMLVKLDVPEKYLDSVSMGTPVELVVDSLGGREFAGVITTVAPYVERQTRTARVEVSVPNPDGLLKHGMFGRLDIAIERINGALVIPANGISWEGERQFAFKVVDGKAARVEVKVGMRTDGHVQILDGLSDGDEVVVGSLYDMKDGEAVRR